MKVIVDDYYNYCRFGEPATINFSSKESIRTFKDGIKKYRIWTPKTNFNFQVRKIKNEILLHDDWGCKLSFTFNDITKYVGDQFIYAVYHPGKVCVDSMLHYDRGYLFDNEEELRQWAINKHYNGVGRTSHLPYLQELTKQNKYLEIFKHITQ